MRYTTKQNIEHLKDNHREVIEIQVIVKYWEETTNESEQIEFPYLDSDPDSSERRRWSKRHRYGGVETENLCYNSSESSWAVWSEIQVVSVSSPDLANTPHTFCRTSSSSSIIHSISKLRRSNFPQQINLILREKTNADNHPPPKIDASSAILAP